MKNPAHALVLVATLVAAASATATPLRAASRTSASYAIAAETLGAGGVAQAQSANYALAGSALGECGVDAAGGNAGPVATGNSYTLKAGFVGTIYNVQGLTVGANPASVDESGNTSQLAAAPLLDDNTLLSALAPATVSWAIVRGPLASVSSAGVVTSATVYQDTTATVRGTFQGLSGQGSVTVRNVATDDFGPYAGDGLDDAWQVQYFGPNNPLAGPDVDADGTGQTNLVKYIAGLNPLDGSRFTLTVTPVPGQSGQKSLSFNPVVAGRTYTVTAASSLTLGGYVPINASVPSDNGTTRTITDLNADGPQKFYRVEITKP